MPRSKRLLVAIPALLVALLVSAGIAGLYRAQRVLDRATHAAAAGQRIPFSLQVVDLKATATAFQPVAAKESFTCGAFLRGESYLGGPGGLAIYAADGSLRRTLRTGLELPVAPISALATARLRGAAEEQLLIATAGAGLLVLSSDGRGGITLQHLLPSAEWARDLTSLLPLPTGELLLGTRHGGVLTYAGLLQPLRLAVSGLDATRLEVTSLAAMESSAILIGTRAAGLVILRGGIAQRLTTDSGLPDDAVASLVSGGGRAFVGTPLGVAELQAAGAEMRVSRVLARGIFSNALALDEAARVLSVGSLDQGMMDLPLGVSAQGRPRIRNAAFSMPAASAAPGSVSQFVPGQKARFAIVDGTLRVRDGSNWREALPQTDLRVALTDRNISALAFDPAGHLYAGFFDRGLDVVDLAGHAPVRHLEDDHLFCINRLMIDPTRGTVAAATANGLVLFDREGTPRQVLTRRDGLISDHISDIAFAAGGTTLATPAGLSFIKPSGTESLYAFQGLVNNHVYTLATTAEGTLLAGTLGGLSVLQGEAVRRSFTASNSGLRHNWITALLPLPGGDSLIGTYGAGILRFSSARDGTVRITPVDLPAGLPLDIVINPNALFVTEHHIVAGTLAHGMLVSSVAGGRWMSVTAGLPSLNVTAFAEHAGTLYVGTQNGLVSIAEDRLP